MTTGQPVPIGAPCGTSLSPPPTVAVSSTRSPRSRIAGAVYGLRVLGVPEVNVHHPFAVGPSQRKADSRRCTTDRKQW